MRRGGLGILIFLIVALLVAFLLTKQMQSPTSLADRVSEKTGEIAAQAAQSAVDAIGEVLENSNLDEQLQNSSLGESLQNVLSQLGGAG